jgi:hypothetical protein
MSTVPLVVRAHLVTAVFAVIIVGELAGIVSDGIYVSLLNRSLAGEFVPDGDWASHEDGRDIVDQVQRWAFWAGAVVFIAWLHGAYRRLDPARRRFGTGWAIGAWFVPVLNFWRPKQLVNVLVGGPRRLTRAWWLLFVLAYYLDGIILWHFPDEWADETRVRTFVYIGLEAVAVVAAVLAILLVRRLTRVTEPAEP